MRAEPCRKSPLGIRVSLSPAPGASLPQSSHASPFPVTRLDVGLWPGFQLWVRVEWPGRGSHLCAESNAASQHTPGRGSAGAQGAQRETGHSDSPDQPKVLLLSGKPPDSLRGQGEGICCTAAMDRPAFTPMFAMGLAEAVEILSLASPPTPPLLKQRLPGTGGSFLGQSPPGLGPQPLCSHRGPCSNGPMVGKNRLSGTSVKFQGISPPLERGLSTQDQLQEMSVFSDRVPFLWRKIFQI